MKNNIEFGDVEALQRALSGNAFGNARVAGIDAALEIRNHTTELKAVTATVLASTAMVIPVAQASAAGQTPNAFGALHTPSFDVNPKTPAHQAAKHILATRTAPGAFETTNSSDTTKVIEVKLTPGDSVWREALIVDAKYGGKVRPTVTEIEQENNIQPNQVRDLAVGRELHVTVGATKTTEADKPPAPDKAATIKVQHYKKPDIAASLSPTTGGAVYPISKETAPSSKATSRPVTTVKKTSSAQLPANQPATPNVSPAPEPTPAQNTVPAATPEQVVPAPATPTTPAIPNVPAAAAGTSAAEASSLPTAASSIPQPETSSPAKASAAVHHKTVHHTAPSQPKANHHTTAHQHKVKFHHLAKAKYLAECSLNSTSPLVGSTPAAKIFSYLVDCDGDSVAGAAGMLGNFQHEDVTLNPEKIENGGLSPNPYDAGSGGWDIEQTTPGSAIFTYAREYGITGKVWRLRTQLEVISGQLKGHSPTGYPDLNATMQNITDPTEAAYLADVDFEGPQYGGNLPNREQLASQAVQDNQALLNSHAATGTGAHKHTEHAHKKKHHSEKPTSTATQSGSAVSNQTSGGTNNPTPTSIPATEHKPHKIHKVHKLHKHKLSSDSTHTSPNAAIYYAALRYNAASYALSMAAGHEGVKQWHRDFPQINPSAVVDCSGLINLAVGTATGGRDEINDDTTTELTDTANWERITFSMAGRGDIIQPAIGDPHVEVIDNVKGETIHTFGAHTSLTAQPNQVGPATYTYNPADVFLRFVGNGAPLGSQIEAPVASHPQSIPKSVPKSVPNVQNHNHHHAKTHSHVHRT